MPESAAPHPVLVCWEKKTVSAGWYCCPNTWGSSVCQKSWIEFTYSALRQSVRWYRSGFADEHAWLRLPLSVLPPPPPSSWLAPKPPPSRTRITVTTSPMIPPRPPPPIGIMLPSPPPPPPPLPRWSSICEVSTCASWLRSMTSPVPNRRRQYSVDGLAGGPGRLEGCCFPRTDTAAHPPCSSPSQLERQPFR